MALQEFWSATMQQGGDYRYLLNSICGFGGVTEPEIVCAGSLFRVRDFLPAEGANALLSKLASSRSWGLKLSDGDRICGVSPGPYRESTWQERRELIDLAYKAARTRFAFLREELWSTSVDAGDGEAPAEFKEAFGSRTFRSHIASVCGYANLSLVRVMVERYSAGQFSGFTQGAPEGAEIGFFLDLTPNWECEWGGVLEFLTQTGSIAAAFNPTFNALYIYRLEVPRGVSIVSPAAEGSRYSISGHLTYRQAEGTQNA